MRSEKEITNQHMKDSIFLSALGELKFVKSLSDLKIFREKMQYLLILKYGGKDRLTSVPLSLQIEPTNHCNANCISCSSSRSTRRRGFMDMDLYKKIIDDASTIGVKRVRFFVHGEPLLHPQILDMIRYTKSKGLSLNLTTNGMLFTREMGEGILRSGVTWADHITFSIMGGSKQVHENIMRKADYDLITENVLNFMELRRDIGLNGPVIQTILHTMPENQHEIRKYLNLWQGKVDHVRLGGDISVSFAEHGRGTGNIRPRETTCVYLWDRMTIFWNGDYSLCSMDVDGDWVLGNLADHSLQEAWNHETIQDVRKIHGEGRYDEFPFCYHCDYSESRSPE